MDIRPASDIETLEVLFIADDPDLAEMYRLKLELDGYWVRVVGADSAVAEARVRRPEIVFLDLPAGRPERLRILRDLRDAVHRPELPAVVLTAFRGQELENKGAILSACDYVVRVPAPNLPALAEQPALRPMPAELSADWRRFCGPDRSREWLGHPLFDRRQRNSQRKRAPTSGL